MFIGRYSCAIPADLTFSRLFGETRKNFRELPATRPKFRKKSPITTRVGLSTERSEVAPYDAIVNNFTDFTQASRDIELARKNKHFGRSRRFESTFFC
jgi:hypothetical protein